MIMLALILFIVGIFVARNILWPVAGVLALIGLLLLVLHDSVGFYTY